jgi:amidase
LLAVVPARVHATDVVPRGAGGIAEVHAELASGTVTRRQHLERKIDVIQHQETTIKAFIDTDLAGTRRTATDADQANGSRVVGPLDGVVVAIKDNLHANGFPTSAGSATLAKATNIQAEAFVVRRLRLAGAVIVGSTNLDTNARGVRGLSQVRGQTVNPRDRRFNAGGSSAGSAAAVAAGMVDVALGTDTCGSLRYPASSVGIFSLRPTHGRISRSGLVPLSPSHDTVGPMAARAADVGRLFAVIDDVDPGDSVTKPAPRELVVPRTSTKRIGVFAALGEVNPSVLSELKAAGYVIVPGLKPPSTSGVNLIEVEYQTSYTAYLAWRKAGGDGEQLWLRPEGPDTSVSRRSAVAEGRKAQVRLAKLMTTELDRLKLDAIIYPTNRYAPVRLGLRQPSGNCMLSAGSGLPALTIPDGSTDGLPPVGVDLIGRAGDDNRLIEIAIDVDTRRPNRASP